MPRKTSRRLKEKLVKLFPEIRNKVQSRLIFAGIDWRKTKAYSDTLFPNIMINLKGREPLGIVSDCEYTEIIQNLKSDLKECRDSETGERIVEEVFAKNEIYSGSHTDNAPDLLIRWREDIVINGIKFENNNVHDKRLSTSYPLIPGEDPRIVSGDHHLKGILFLKGPYVKQDHVLKGTKIIDIAPTVLYLLNCPIPGDMDGEVPIEAFMESYLEKKLLRIQKRGIGEKVEAKTFSEYSTKDSEEVAKRLRDLGYLE